MRQLSKLRTLVLAFAMTLGDLSQLWAQPSQDSRLRESDGIRIEFESISPKKLGFYVLVRHEAAGWQVVRISETPDIRRTSTTEEVLYVSADLQHIQPFFEKVERPVQRGKFECNVIGAEKTAYTPCTSSLTIAHGASVGKVVTAIMTFGFDAGTFRILDADAITTLISESGLIEKIREKRYQVQRERAMALYRQEFSQARTIPQMNAFVSKYVNDDPDSLVEILRERLDSIAERNRVIMEQMKVNEAMRASRVAEFRRGLTIESSTNCGPVLESKSTLVKVYFPVAQFGAEHWIRRDQVFPPGYPCRFVDGVYVTPTWY